LLDADLDKSEEIFEDDSFCRVSVTHVFTPLLLRLKGTVVNIEIRRLRFYMHRVVLPKCLYMCTRTSAIWKYSIRMHRFDFCQMVVEPTACVENNKGWFQSKIRRIQGANIQHREYRLSKDLNIQNVRRKPIGKSQRLNCYEREILRRCLSAPISSFLFSSLHQFPKRHPLIKPH
jgi:hypothetical protein